jgi:hypothetical protein
MNMIVKLYAALTVVSRWIESLRVALLVRAWGIANGCKPPAPWREREKLPDHNQWPMVRDKDSHLMRPVGLKGAVKVGPIRPVPAKFDKSEDSRG